jgi:hypothetical protein
MTIFYGKYVGLFFYFSFMSAHAFLSPCRPNPRVSACGAVTGMGFVHLLLLLTRLAESKAHGFPATPAWISP